MYAPYDQREMMYIQDLQGRTTERKSRETERKEKRESAITIRNHHQPLVFWCRTSFYRTSNQSLRRTTQTKEKKKRKTRQENTKKKKKRNNQPTPLKDQPSNPTLTFCLFKPPDRPIPPFSTLPHQSPTPDFVSSPYVSPSSHTMDQNQLAVTPSQTPPHHQHHHPPEQI